jgi:hypothetical protein
MKYEKIFTQLCIDVFCKNITTKDINTKTILTILHNYIDEIYTRKDKHAKYVMKKIEEAPTINRIIIKSYQPGTGEGTAQLYKILKAIYTGKITSKNIKVNKLFQVLYEYHFDQIE